MRLRILLAIVLMTCARPALASDPPGVPDKKAPSVQTLIVIADLQLDAAFDERTVAGDREELLDKARKSYQKALEIDPKGKEPLLSMARFYARVGEREKADETFGKYFGLHPNDVEAAHEYAMANAKWKEWPRAVKCCEYALKLDPENRSVKKTMGFCLAMAGKWEEAFATLSQAIPEAQARHNLAGLLKEMGKPEDAKKQLELALKADPVYAPAIEMLREFEKTRIRDTIGHGRGSVGAASEWVPAGSVNPSVCFECRLIKIPVAARDLVKFPLADGDILNAEQMKQLLTGIQSEPNGGLMMCPKLCAANGESGTMRVCDSQYLTSGIEAVKVKGQTVFVPQNKLVEIGHTFVFGGKISADKKSVETTAKITRTWMNGPVELQPIITPFAAAKGPATGTKLFAEQYLQVADIRTEKVEKQAAVPVDCTLVMRSWTETEEKPTEGKKKSKPQTVEYVCVPLVTVRVQSDSTAPKTVSTPAMETKVFAVDDLVIPASGVQKEYLENTEKLVKLVTGMVRPYSWKEQGGSGIAEYFDIGCSLVVKNSPEVLKEVDAYLESLRRMKATKAAQVSPLVQSSCVSGFGGAVHAELAGASRKLKAYKLKHASAQDAASIIQHKFNDGFPCCSLAESEVRVTFDRTNNTLFVQCDCDHLLIIDKLVEQLDNPRPQVSFTAMVVKVPQSFIAQSGLNIDGKADAKSWTLSARETHMLTGLVRTSKERGECKMLSRPMICVGDGQTGCVRIGEHLPVATTDASGVQQVQNVPLGLKLDLTPKISADRSSVSLATSLQFTEVQGAVKLAVVKDGPGTQPPATEFTETPVFGTFSARETVRLRFGETLVLATSPCQRNVSGEALKKECEKDEPFVTLVIVTPVQK